MSESAKLLFESLKGVKDAVQTMAPGLKDLIPEIGVELRRQGVQGSMEIASALFNNNGFVPYGPGQYTPSVSPHHEHEQSRGMGR